MKKALILLVGLVVAASALAGPGGKDKKSEKIPATMKCAVTGESLKTADAMKKHMYTDYKGRRYFFCCNGCPQSFKKDPAKYAKNNSIPVPADEKTKVKSK